MSDHQDKPLSPMQLVMGTYGATMFQIQIWEFNIASLANAAHTPIGPAASPAAAERQSRRGFERIVHLTQRATATEMRNLLHTAPTPVEPSVIDEISELIPLRDRLAHRYLREELINPRAGFTFSPSVQQAVDLSGFSDQFRACSATMEAETRRILGLHGPEPTPDEVLPLVMEKFAPLLFTQGRPAQSRATDERTG
jgi:hypothetical protein